MTFPTLPTIAITMGDPAGIGPEVTMKAIANESWHGQAQWVVIGEAWLANQYRQEDQVQPPVVKTIEELPSGVPVVVLDAACLARSQAVVGRVDPRCGRASLEYVKRAIDACLRGTFQAMVTGPICKEAVVLGGQPGFCGHTEFIADRCGVDESRLMLFHERLRVVHVSTHVSLARAIELCNEERVLKTIMIGHAAMQRLGWARPRIAVCGLNPHAGEHGLFGDEESVRIAPAIATACAAGIDCHGPFPADTLLLQAARGRWDLVVSMYHDQTHVAMKLFDFEHTVNVTLGLPIIRTSVDHGTAFDIAGTNQASADCMQAAMQLALRMCRGDRNQDAPCVVDLGPAC